ncbi:hypothetical protein FXO37_29032 [Capsicum annuum]|nr:hypothetical protein FXO37_29032 [Capsicum annuum]
MIMVMTCCTLASEVGMTIPTECLCRSVKAESEGLTMEIAQAVAGVYMTGRFVEASLDYCGHGCVVWWIGLDIHELTLVYFALTYYMFGIYPTSVVVMLVRFGEGVKFHVSRAPSNLLCREIENNRILEFCKQAVEQEKAGSWFICGCPGTGKSLSIEKANKVLVNWAEEELKGMVIVGFLIPGRLCVLAGPIAGLILILGIVGDGTWGTIKVSYAYGSELYTGNVNLSKGESSRSRRKIIIGSSVGASTLLLATIVLRYLIKVLNDLICEQTPPTFSIVKSFIGKGPLNDGELLIRSLKLIIVIAETLQYKLGMLDLGLYNAACIAQLNGGFIKGDKMKHISSKLFYSHDLQKNGDINMQQIRSSDNVADLFTKSPPIATFEKMIHKIGMQRFKDVLISGS